MTFIRVIVLAAAFAAATYFVGWWSVPVIAATYALVLRKQYASGDAALAALLGWGALLARVAVAPAFTTLLARMGGIFPIPGTAVVALTLLFAVLLAWSAARVVSALVAREQTVS
ncbi:MAG: hypothetical protein ABI852_13265 [Gemmatimonadaceae bacterium]